MALYINKSELINRITNGFITHDGYIDGEFYDIYREKGINVNHLRMQHMINVMIDIINSMDDTAINIYPNEYRGQKVREIRIAQGMTVTELQRRTGLSKTQIYRIEKAQVRPFPETMQKIADALGVNVSEFGG